MHLHPFWPLCKKRSGSNPKNQAVKKRLKTFREWVGLHAALWSRESSCSFCLLLLCLLWPDDLSAQVTCHLFCSFTQEWPSESRDTDPSSYLSQFPNQILDWRPISLIWWQGQTTNLAHLHLVINIGLEPVCLSGHQPGREETVSVFPSGCHFFRLLQLDSECRHHEIQPG